MLTKMCYYLIITHCIPGGMVLRDSIVDGDWLRPGN